MTQIVEPLPTAPAQVREDEGSKEAEKTSKHMIFLHYKGKCTEAYARALHRVKAPCNIVLTLRKLKTVLPSLKPQIEKHIRSCIVYSFQCPRCETCYVGATTRHYIYGSESICAQVRLRGNTGRHAELNGSQRQTYKFLLRQPGKENTFGR